MISKASHTTLGALAPQETSLWRVAGPRSPERHWWTGGSPCAALGKVERHRTDHTANIFSTLTNPWQADLASSPKLLFWMAGLSFQDLDTKFWRRRRVQHSESDVILRSGFVCEASCFSSQNWLGSCQRTKRWMSDASFQPKIFWYLPASVANEISLKPPPPGVSVLT